MIEGNKEILNQPSAHLIQNINHIQTAIIFTAAFYLKKSKIKYTKE